MYLTNESGKVYYHFHGPEDAPTVVFSHGVAMDHRTFNDQVSALEKDYRVIVWDMPYHGRSWGIDRDLRFSKTAADFLIAILDELAIDQATLAGLSLGSLVTQEAAYRYPNRVNACVHISGGPLYPKYSPILIAMIPMITLSMKLYPFTPLKKAFAEHKALADETKAYLMETVSQTGKDMITHLTNEMVRDMVIGIPEPNTQPSLIVYGDHDIRFLRNMSIKWHQRQPNSQLVEIKNAHHILNQDNPAAFNAALLSFLAEIRNA